MDKYKQIKSKKRHESQDKLLAGFVTHPNYTGKEVADALGFGREGYCNSPKRAYDLASNKLGYLEKSGERECRCSTAVASTYKITEEGRQHLRQKNMMPLPVQVSSTGKATGMPKGLMDSLS